MRILIKHKKRIRAQATNCSTAEPSNSNIPTLINELKTLTVNPNKKIKKVFLKL